MLKSATDADNELTSKEDILTVYLKIDGVTGLKLLGFLPCGDRVPEGKMIGSIESILR